MRDSLCWTCKNCINGCEWSRSFEPVPGWKATPTIISNYTRPTPSFHVEECPKYVRAWRHVTHKEIAAELGVAPDTVGRWASKKIIDEYAKLGRKLKNDPVKNRYYEVYSC